jgi:membrane protein required for colicin V production
MLIDALFAILVILACIKGYRTGLVVAFFSIIGFIAGIAAALKLSSIVAARLSANVNVSGKWLPVISFLVVFLAVVILVNLGARFIQRSFELIMLGWLNRIGGMILFILIYSIVFSIFLFYAVQLHFIKGQTIKASQCYSFIQPLGPAVINKLGTAIPFFRDMFSQLQQFFSRVGNKI